MTIRLLGMLVTLGVAAAYPAAAACQGTCYENPFGCINPGGTCFDWLTGCGRCESIIPFIGPCVCDPSRGDTTVWFGEGLFVKERPTGFGMRLQPKYPSWGPSTTTAGPLPVPRPGDRLCGDQIGVATVLHHYNLPWGFAADDRLDVEGTSFCVEVVGPVEGDPDWIEFRMVDLRGFLPSFRPSALPAFETGDNHVTLDDLPSRGKLHLPTGTFVAEVHARLTNDLFGPGSPVPLRAGLRGTLESGEARLLLDRALVISATPEDYQGPFPD